MDIDQAVRIVGVDETGRGSCIGPVVTCAVAFPADGIPDNLLSRLGDSKKLTEKRRLEAAALLHDVVDYAFGAASAAEVDAMNPLKATMLAMKRAVRRLGVEGFVKVDGPFYPDLELPGEAVVRGDASVPEIMAASILAKVFRDHLVSKLSARHGGYALERNAGYGTAAHFAAIATLGPTKHHRLTFIRKALAAA